MARVKTTHHLVPSSCPQLCHAHGTQAGFADGAQIRCYTQGQQHLTRSGLPMVQRQHEHYKNSIVRVCNSVAAL